LRALKGLRGGSLAVDESGTETKFGSIADDRAAIDARIEVLDSRFFRAVAAGGSLGAAQAYIQGWWRSDDLVAVMQLMARNDSLGAQSPVVALGAAIGGAMRRIFQRNTRAGNRRNVSAHYDLGNEFFRLMLDESMTYSCGLFERPNSSLAEASRSKYDLVCRKLALGPRDHVLEIGTGWGGFALHAAGEYGCRVTTTTISRQQRCEATARVAAAGLSQRVTVLGEDYRDLTGQYDALVSIEMIEAVGHAYFNRYFATCSRLLKSNGAMLLQAITIPDQHYDRYRRGTDFIRRYVFPGGLLPSLGTISGSVRRMTDLRIVHLQDFAAHYATTLRCWRQRFFENLAPIRALGYSDEFLRMWEFYLCYCEAGFRERTIGVAQIVLAKPAWRGEV
jgi:cyclopropane-fatty-acyl-phospholipid synthase